MHSHCLLEILTKVLYLGVVSSIAVSPAYWRRPCCLPTQPGRGDPEPTQCRDFSTPHRKERLLYLENVENSALASSVIAWKPVRLRRPSYAPGFGRIIEISHLFLSSQLRRCVICPNAPWALRSLSIF